MNKTLFKTIWLSLMLAFTLMLFTPTLPVMGSNVTQTTYVAVIRITNTGAAAYNVSVPLTLNTSQWVNSYYFASNLSNTAMIDNHGNDTAYNPAVVANTTWMIFVPEIAANSVIDYRLYLGGGIDAGGRLALIPDTTTALATADNASLELGNNFSITQTGFLDTSYATVKNLVNKAGALVVNVTAAENITATMGSAAMTATNVGSGYHTVELQSNGVSASLLVDSVTKCTSYGTGMNATSTNGTGTWSVYSAQPRLAGNAWPIPESPKPEYLASMDCSSEVASRPSACILFERRIASRLASKRRAGGSL